MPDFVLTDIVKEYEGRGVLYINHLELESNKIYSVLGPNGAGKSTLLKVLNLLERPTRGKLCFLGRDTGAIGEGERLGLRRQMCMVLQSSHMFRGSVFSNVAYGLRLRGLAPAQVKERVNEALDFVRLEGFNTRSAGKLSGGETQRVALARAIALRPRVLLLDEPTANLDPENVALVEELVRRTRDIFGTTVIVVTHNLFQARRISDEVLFLYQGRLVEKQETAGIFTSPQSELTRQFVSGTMIY